jgi:hypothetical protein
MLLHLEEHLLWWVATREDVAWLPMSRELARKISSSPCPHQASSSVKLLDHNFLSI